MSDIQLLTYVIIFFGVLFFLMGVWYIKKKKMISDRIDRLERKSLPELSFSDKILISYFNELKNINTELKHLVVFADFLRNKLLIVKDMAEIILINYDKTSKSDLSKVFEIKRKLIKENLHSSKLPPHLKNTLSRIAKKQVEQVKFRLSEISELDLDADVKHELIKDLLLAFVKDNFSQSVLNFNLLENEHNADVHNSTDFEAFISKNMLSEAVIELKKTGKQKLEVLQLESQITDFEINELNGTLNAAEIKNQKAQLVKQLLKLNGLIERG